MIQEVWLKRKGNQMRVPDQEPWVLSWRPWRMSEGFKRTITIRFRKI